MAEHQHDLSPLDCLENVVDCEKIVIYFRREQCFSGVNHFCFIWDLTHQRRIVLFGGLPIPLKFFEDFDCLTCVGHQDDGLLNLVCRDVDQMLEGKSE